VSDQNINYLKFAIPVRSETLEAMAEQINDIVGRVYENSSGQRFLYAGISSVSLVIANEFHVLGEAGKDPVPQRIYEAIIIPQINQLPYKGEENGQSRTDERETS
jgi:hypothetical protein